jgi:thioredoxin 1
MASPNLKELTVANFDAQVTRAGQPVLVSFIAAWNGMSRELLLTLEKLADEYAGRAVVGYVDTDSEPPLTLKYEVRSLPTTILFEAGRAAPPLPGLRPEQELRTLLGAALAKRA